MLTELRGAVRHMSVPQGFTLSIAGVLALSMSHWPDAPPVAIWLFVVGAALSYCTLALATLTHRRTAAALSPVGYQIFNLLPIAVVPGVATMSSFVTNVYLSFSLAGAFASTVYLLSIAALFRVISYRRQRRAAVALPTPDKESTDANLCDTGTSRSILHQSKRTA